MLASCTLGDVLGPARPLAFPAHCHSTLDAFVRGTGGLGASATIFQDFLPTLKAAVFASFLRGVLGADFVVCFRRLDGSFPDVHLYTRGTTPGAGRRK